MDRRQFLAVSAATAVGLARPRGAFVRTESDGYPDFSGGTPGGVIVPWHAYVPEQRGPFPGVIVLHGGRFVAGSKDETRATCNVLKEAGYAAMTLDYTLATRSEPGWPTAVYDVIRFLDRCRGDRRLRLAGPIGLLGCSAGGTIAHEVGMLAVNKPTAIATMSGLQNLRAAYPTNQQIGFYLGCEPEFCGVKWRAASPLESVTALQPPTFLMNSTNEIVPVIDPQSYAARLEELGVPFHLKLYEGPLHGSMLLDRAQDEMLEFFARTLNEVSLAR